ncbi:hypothetical protein WN55_01287 [Dufourea novaeangliae]|uniref:Uncharacterized protein n=1 Tax=Dufourea novaeangliae TaxID=178035 RepID=A0A154NWH8_DUFNO|nr:hypothetical protein WN55_01287 [Dufourea novaeangliae]
MMGISYVPLYPAAFPLFVFCEEEHDRSQWRNHKRTVQISHVHLDGVSASSIKETCTFLVATVKATVAVKPHKMSRSIFAFFVALAVLQAASAVDISKYKSVRLEFNESHMVLKTKLLGGGDERASGFIGDLFVGQRYADEIVFRRVVEFDNPTNTVQTTSLNLSITNGKLFHSIINFNTPCTIFHDQCHR